MRSFTLQVKRVLLRVLNRLGSFVPRDVETRLTRAEEDLFEKFRAPAETVPVVFILAAPRTGSTMLYQLMAKCLRLHYFSNYVVEYFPTHPLVGTVIESIIADDLADGISLRSRYGETAGLHEPSEATKLLDNWFPHEHPSETASDRIRRGKRPHLVDTVSGVTSFTGLPLVIKNAWNCFRVKELAAAFPAARFVWLRRDIVSSSFSALKARRRQGDPSEIWNSASPANYAEIRGLPYIEQVVEQQYWTNDAVAKSLRDFVPAEQWVEVWYEDVLAEPLAALEMIDERIPRSGALEPPLLSTVQDLDLRPSNPDVKSDEFDQVLQYAGAKYPNLVRH